MFFKSSTFVLDVKGGLKPSLAYVLGVRPRPAFDPKVIPNDVWREVATYLKRDDLYNLRFSCSHLEQIFKPRTTILDLSDDLWLTIYDKIYDLSWSESLRLSCKKAKGLLKKKCCLDDLPDELWTLIYENINDDTDRSQNNLRVSCRRAKGLLKKKCRLYDLPDELWTLIYENINDTTNRSQNNLRVSCRRARKMFHPRKIIVLMTLLHAVTFNGWFTERGMGGRIWG
jgi:hypothetical protein